MPDGGVIRHPPGAAARDARSGLRDLVDTLRTGWRVIVGAALGAVALAVAALWLVPAEHTAVMIVGPTARFGSAAMGARVPVIMGRETALAAAEPGAGDESLSDFARYLELFGSGAVAERLAADPAFLRTLYPERWGADTPGEAPGWRPPPGLAPVVKRALLALVGRQDWVEPDAERVGRTLRERLVIDMVRTGPMRRISLRHRDRATASALLGRVAAATDAHLRAEASRRSVAQIAHIKARLASVTVAEHRRALSDLLSDQERVAMMIEVDLPFAADVIQAPTAPALPDWPNPAALVPLAGLVGLLAGSLALSVRAAWRESAA